MTTPPAAPVPYLTAAQVAERFQVAPETIHIHAARHCVGFKVGSRWRFTERDVHLLEQALRQVTAAQHDKSLVKTKRGLRPA